MSLVDLSVVMRPYAQVAIGEHGEPGIRLEPIRPGSIPGINPAHTWAWAVVQRRAGEPDALLVGGTAESKGEALGQASDAGEKMGLRWAVRKGLIDG